MFRIFKAYTSYGALQFSSKIHMFYYVRAHFEHVSFCKMASQETGSGCSSSLESKECDSPSSRTVSDVWKYFTKTSDKQKAVCSICQK